MRRAVAETCEEIWKRRDRAIEDVAFGVGEWFAAKGRIERRARLLRLKMAFARFEAARADWRAEYDRTCAEDRSDSHAIDVWLNEGGPQRWGDEWRIIYG